MSWEKVKELRKLGDLKGARKLGLELLAANPDDYRVSWELEWVFHDESKAAVASIFSALAANRMVSSNDVDAIDTAVQSFTALPKPQVPGMACSNILLQLAKVADKYPRYAAFLEWVGIGRLRPEDWQPNRYNGREFAPLGVRCARGLVKWVKTRPDASPARMTQALEWLDRARDRATGNDLLWLQWDRVALLRRTGEHVAAAEALSSVIKAKRNESWVWAEAARIYVKDDPDLALACFCRALECPADPEYTVSVNRELAELLATTGDFAQASREITTAVDIRTGKGWGLGRELETLVASPWYDPAAAGALEPNVFYRSHSERALELCFDRMEVRPATFIGVVELGPVPGSAPGAKPRTHPRFAVRDERGRSVTMLGPHQRNITWTKGQQLLLYLGWQEGAKNSTVVRIEVRGDGARWDCTDPVQGLVVSSAVGNSTTVRVHLDRSNSARLSLGDWLGDREPQVGAPVECQVVNNPRTGRTEIVRAADGSILPQDVRTLTGGLRRNPNGFGFVDDVFVSPQLMSDVPAEAENVGVMAVYGQRLGSEDYSWRAVTVTTSG